MSTTTTDTTWVRSSYSGNGGGNCVEWSPEAAAATGTVPVRDSKDPQKGILTASPSAWSAFLSFAQDANV